MSPPVKLFTHKHHAPRYQFSSDTLQPLQGHGRLYCRVHTKLRRSYSRPDLNDGNCKRSYLEADLKLTQPDLAR